MLKKLDNSLNDKVTFKVEHDVFSSGQIGSKIWLCQELEKISACKDAVIWILAGWYSISAFLIFSRQQLYPRKIRSFDIDPECETKADILNENWLWQDWRFKAFTQDANSLDYACNKFGPAPDLVINTSTEHFENNTWFDLIPLGTLVALQSNNMPHKDHHFTCQSSEELLRKFPLNHLLFQGKKHFIYPDWKFTRFMTIGVK